MRRLPAILLLVLLLFNWVGYQLLSVYLQHRATIQLEAKLDREEYAEKDLIELKIPVSIPYQNNQERFERYDGEIQINGKHYKYVKRRIYNDSLVLLCLPDRQKTEIQHARADFFKMVNNLQSASSENTGKGHSAVFKNVLSEFIPGENKWSMNSCSELPLVRFPIHQTPGHFPGHKAVPEIPPESLPSHLL